MTFCIPAWEHVEWVFLSFTTDEAIAKSLNLFELCSPHLQSDEDTVIYHAGFW